MYRLRQALIGGLAAGLIFVTGCASSNPCGCPREGLLVRLGLRRPTPVVTEGPCCASPLGGGPFIATPTSGPIYGAVPPGDFHGTMEGPVLPPTSVPPTLPYPSPGPGTIVPAAPPEEARPIPAGPSSRRT